MAANQFPIYPKAPSIDTVSLVGAVALTNRANITGTAGLTQLTQATTEGRRIDRIDIKGQGNTVASQLFIWLYDGTTARLIDEITIDLVNASNTATSFEGGQSYTNLVLEPTQTLWISQTIQTNVNVTAYGGDY